jgi:hypothetical protein
MCTIFDNILLILGGAIDSSIPPSNICFRRDSCPDKQDIASFIVFRLGLRVAIVKGVFVVAIDNIYTHKLMEK